MTQVLVIGLLIASIGFMVGTYKAFKRKEWKRGFKRFGLGSLSFFIMIITIAILANSPEQKTKDAAQAQAQAQQDAQDAQKKVQADAQKAAQKAQQDEKDKLVAQFKEAGATDKNANDYADNVIAQGKGDDKARQEAIQVYLKYAKQDKESRDYMDWVNSKFSAWDGSCPALVDAVKQNMNDPSSFKHVETTYESMGVKKGIKVYMTYRGTNAFGGVVTNHATATFNYGEKTFTYTTGG